MINNNAKNILDRLRNRNADLTKVTQENDTEFKFHAGQRQDIVSWLCDERSWIFDLIEHPAGWVSVSFRENSAAVEFKLKWIQ